MKKLILLLAPVLLLTGCDGCDSELIEEETITNTYYLQDKMQFEFFIDKETCVEYIEYDGSYSGTLTPRLNADGTLKLNEICLENKEE